MPPFRSICPASELIRVALPSVIALVMVLLPDTFCSAPLAATPVPFNVIGPAIDPAVIANVPPVFTVTVSPTALPKAPALVKVPPLMTTLPFIAPVAVFATVPAAVVTFPVTIPVLVKKLVAPLLSKDAIVPPFDAVPELVTAPAVPVVLLNVPPAALVTAPNDPPLLVTVPPVMVVAPVTVPLLAILPKLLLRPDVVKLPPAPMVSVPPVLVTPLVAVRLPLTVRVPALSAIVFTVVVSAAPNTGWFAKAPLFSTTGPPAPGATSPAQLVPVRKLLSVSPSHACADSICGAPIASPRAKAVVVSSLDILRELGTKNWSTITIEVPAVFDILKIPTRGRKSA